MKPIMLWILRIYLMIALKKKKQFSEFTEGQNSLSQFCRAFGKKKSFSDGQIWIEN